MPHGYVNCTAVSPDCPVSATTYGYAPNLPGNAVLLVVFGLCAICQLGLGTWSRAWSFTLALFGGCFLEALGYAGRLMMHYNAWSQNGFKIQICCIVIAPSFVAAGVYLSLKHIIIYVGPEYSRLKPKLYTWLFIGFDLFSIMIQAAGGGIAASAGKRGQQANLHMLKIGDDLIVAGIAFQVFNMVVCGALAADFALRYRRGTRNPSLTEKGADRSATPINHAKFRIFCIAEIIAYVCVLARCIYRIPEMAGGWGNGLMRKESEFLVLDGFLMAIAALLFTIFHPHFWFPPMTGRYHKHRRALHSTINSDNSS